MKVVWGVTETKDFDHVRVQADFRPGTTPGTLKEFEDEIKKRYPKFDRYFWRHRPSREEHREFATDGISVRFYARFTVQKSPQANRIGAPTVREVERGED
jgi:hypothetical protein